MDDRRQFAPAEARRESSSALPFAEQREQIRRFLGELSETTSSAEAEIAGVVKRLLDDIASRNSGSGVDPKELAAREAAAAEQRRQIDDLQRQIREQTAELDRLRESAAQRGGETAEAERRLQAATRELEQRRNQLESEVEETARLKTRLEDKLRRQESLEEELEAERSRTKMQRRRIAAELREQYDVAKREHRRRIEELEARGDELERRERALHKRGEDLERQSTELAAARARGADDAQLRDELTRLQASLAERGAELNQALGELAEARNDVHRVQTALAEAEERLEQLASAERRHAAAQAEAAELRTLLDEAHARIAAAADDEPQADLSGELQDLQTALAIAQEDLRDLRNRNAVLEKAQAASGERGGDGGGGALPMDWESQKRRLLAALESDFDDSKPAERADKLTIEGTIQITDNVVADKEREIAELRRILEQQSCNVGEIAVGGAALAAALDQDQLIREHREQIEDLKRQWEAKLREAEVEISIERAKVARDRTMLEEKRAEIEALQAQQGLDAPNRTVDATTDLKRKQAGGGRWLARLGLRDDEQA